MVGPRDQVRKRIIERNRYSPKCPEMALRASVPGWKGTVQPLQEQPGDIHITTIGVAKDEQPS